MNISQMMRGLLGDAVSGDTRALELKNGQVVRGVVLQALDNNEALIQINGVQVRAKLEMPLAPGQSAMLQVQPDSSGTLVVLKAVDLSASGLLDDTFREYVKLLSLPDQRFSLDIVKDLRREGFPINRTTAKAFHEAAAAMPREADPEQWMTAAAATFKRGLPMTETTIASMGQAMFGRAMHDLLDSLQTQLSAFVSVHNGEAGLEAKPAQQAGARLLALLEQGAGMMRGLIFGEVANAAAGRAPGIVAMADALNSASSQAGELSADEPGLARNGGSPSAPAAGSNWLGGMMKWLGVDHELQLARAATENASGHPDVDADKQMRQPPGDAGSASRQSSSSNAAHMPDTHAGNNTGVSGTGVAAAAPNDSTNVDLSLKGAHSELAAGIGGGRDLQSSGNGETRPPMHAVTGAASGVGQLQYALEAGLATERVPGGAQSASSSQGFAAQAETLKSVLIGLVGANDTPPTIKETAQQLVLQITGQQLLLTPERNSSVFTHVTMFIPLRDSNGGTTASVHIQTRRGRRGELDADNCRLLFNLSMASLGDTLVDVNITDKIVSLNIWNDHPAIAELIEGSRADIAERLHGTGYQLLSLRTSPLPDRSAEPAGAASDAKTKVQAPPDLAQFASTRYKGVDYRI